MKSRLFFILTAALCLGLLSGCKTKPVPHPDLTRPDGANVGDYVSSGSAFGGAGQIGLTSDGELIGPRYPSFLSGTQVRDILKPVYFDFDQSAVKASERPKLQTAFEHLRSNPSDRLLVEGYCDWRGTAEYNLALGDRRANSVRTFLVNLGIDPARIDILSKGDLEAATNGTEEQMAQDRRAELVIVR